MKKILVFAGSNSSTSINHQLVEYAGSIIENHHVKTIRLTDYPLPIFGEDIERTNGYTEELHHLKNEISQSDALIISVNEHNGSVSAFFKNTLDWLSRLEYKFLTDKKVLLLSTSTGKRGGASALEYATRVIPRFGAELIGSFALPAFSDNFSKEKNCMVNDALNTELIHLVKNFENLLGE